MAKVKLSDKEQVTEHIAALDHSLKDAIEAILQTILDTDAAISEQIKWNSPAFYYSGEMAPFDPKEYKRDIIVMHLRKKDEVLLVFPNGATILDPTGLLKAAILMAAGW